MATITMPFVSLPGFNASIQYDDVTLAIVSVSLSNSGRPITLVLMRGTTPTTFLVADGQSRTLNFRPLGLAFIAGVSPLGLPVKSLPDVELGTR